jgi:hypothetical protein
MRKPAENQTSTKVLRRRWIRPSVVELRAGSADFNVGRIDDGVDRS